MVIFSLVCLLLIACAIAEVVLVGIVGSLNPLRNSGHFRITDTIGSIMIVLGISAGLLAIIAFVIAVILLPAGPLAV